MGFWNVRLEIMAIQMLYKSSICKQVTCLVGEWGLQIISCKNCALYIAQFVTNVLKIFLK